MTGTKRDAQGRLVKWAHGFIRYDKAGKARFYIREWRGDRETGKRYVIATDARDEQGAVEEWLKFQKDRDAYCQSPSGPVPLAPIPLSDDLILKFLRWSETEAKRPNGKSWLHQKRVHLQWWQQRLGKLDLRRAKVGRDFLPALEGTGSKGHKIHVLRHLFTYLIAVDLIEAREDPTYKKLSPPPSHEPEVEAVPISHFPPVRLALAEPWRSVFVLQCVTGMHATELVRFAESGHLVEPNEGREDGAAKILQIAKHKNGRPYCVAIRPQHVASAETVLAHGKFGARWYARKVTAACKKVGVPTITSRLARHTYLTNAHMKGATVQEAGESCGHLDSKTTGRYVQVAKKMVAPLLDGDSADGPLPGAPKLRLK